MSASFAETVTKTVIPTIERMIEKETDHLNYMRAVACNAPNGSAHELAKKFAHQSTQLITHYNTRLKEYREYVEKHKDEGGAGV
jgi:hypothetical protein